MGLRVFFFLLLFAGFVRGVSANEEPQDTLYLFSGEILAGEIKEMRLGKITIDSEGLGVVNIKVSKVSSISTQKDPFRIETTDQMVYYGVLKPSDKAGFVYIVSSETLRTIAVNHINSMTSVQRSFVNSLQGTVSAGFSYTHSSGIGQLNLSSNVYFFTKRLIISLSTSGNSSIDTSTFSRDREDVSFSSFYNLRHSSRWYLVGQVDYQRNLELSIARRFQEVAGVSLKFILGSNFQLFTISGLSINQERSTEGAEDLLMEIPVGFSFNYYKFSKPNLQVNSKNMFYISLSQQGRIRDELNTSVSWELIHNFSLSLTFYLSYDRRPPDSDTGKVDYGPVIGLSFKF